MSKIKEAIEKAKTKEEMPKEAYAIVGDPHDQTTWKLPHHTREINRALRENRDIEKTVDWDRMPQVVASLSRAGFQGERIKAEPEEIIQAARHLAQHYEKAGKPIPVTLAVLI